MKIETNDYLRLVENAGTICSWDIEATGLRGDYNSVLCVSIKPYAQSPITFKVKQPGNDKKLVREVKEELEKYDCWITYYGKGYDRPMINTRLLKWGLDPLKSRHHIDLYYSCKAHLLTARRSQGHLLAWLDAPEQKITVGADVWAQVVSDPKAIDILAERCASDTIGTENLYDRTKHLIREIKAG